jgi:hypothetical protein
MLKTGAEGADGGPKLAESVNTDSNMCESEHEALAFPAVFCLLYHTLGTKRMGDPLQMIIARLEPNDRKGSPAHSV